MTDGFINHADLSGIAGQVIICGSAVTAGLNLVQEDTWSSVRGSGAWEL